MNELDDDIARYLSGRMSAAEMHTLEKKALDDPFLADALAGAETVSADDFAADVAALQEKIGKRTTVAPPANADSGRKPGRQVPLWGWPVRIAAGLLLLAGASAIFYFMQDDVRNDNLALSEKPAEIKEEDSASKPASGKAAADSDDDAGTASTQRKENAANATAETNELKPADKADLGRQAISAPPAASPQTQTVQPITEETAEIASDAEAPAAEPAERRALAYEAGKDDANAADTKAAKEKVNADAPRSVSPSEGYIAKGAGEEKKSDTRSKKIFTGKVVDAEGTGIPGVNVIVKGTNTGTVTDINGNYQLALDDLKPTLVYTFIGYMNTEEEAEVEKPATIKLDEDVAQLSEVVVVGYGAQREMDPLESTYEFANPAGGRRQYKKYLEKNLQYPQQALLNNVEGRVTVQFAVETTGTLADFKVIKGIGNGCDEEVIRLIKSGPKWTPTKRDDVAEKSLIKVRMRFQLPKEKKK